MNYSISEKIHCEADLTNHRFDNKLEKNWQFVHFAKTCCMSIFFTSGFLYCWKRILILRNITYLCLLHYYICKDNVSVLIPIQYFTNLARWGKTRLVLNAMLKTQRRCYISTLWLSDLKLEIFFLLVENIWRLLKIYAYIWDRFSYNLLKSSFICKEQIIVCLCIS